MEFVLFSAFSRGDLVTWLADVDGECAGLVSILTYDMPPKPEEERTREGYVVNMFVTEPYRRRGIGAALFAACLHSAQELDLRRIFLMATDDGRPLYERAGFVSRSADWLELPLRSPGDPKQHSSRPTTRT